MAGELSLSRQKILRELLTSAAAAGQSMASIYNDKSNGFAKNTVIKYNRLWGIIDTESMWSLDGLNVIAELRKDGTTLSAIQAKNPQISKNTLRHYVAKKSDYRVPRNKYSVPDDKIVEILTYAKEYGVIAATMKYDVSDCYLRKQNKLHGYVYPEKKKGEPVSMARKIEIVDSVVAYNRKHGGYDGLNLIAAREGKEASLIRKWADQQGKIVSKKQRKSRSPLYTHETFVAIYDILNECMSWDVAWRATGIRPERLKELVDKFGNSELKLYNKLKKTSAITIETMMQKAGVRA